MRALFVAILLGLPTVGQAHSIWLEAGVGYRSVDVETFQPAFKFGVRGTLPIHEPVSGFAALAWRGGVVVDAGVWYDPVPGLADPIGFRAHLGLGMTHHLGSWGLSGSAAMSYELTRDLRAFGMYTHRLLLLPSIDQAFDISLGLRVALE